MSSKDNESTAPAAHVSSSPVQAFRKRKGRTRKRPRSPNIHERPMDVQAYDSETVSLITSTPKRRVGPTRQTTGSHGFKTKEEKMPHSLSHELNRPVGRTLDERYVSAVSTEDKDDPDEQEADREWYTCDEMAGTSTSGSRDLRSAPSGTINAVVPERQQANPSRQTTHLDQWQDAQMAAALGRQPVKSVIDRDVDADHAVPRVSLVLNPSSPDFLQAYEDLDSIAAIEAGSRSTIVLPVKDPTSDMVVLARRGSALVEKHRELRTRGATQSTRSEAQPKSAEPAPEQTGPVRPELNVRSDSTTADASIGLGNIASTGMRPLKRDSPGLTAFEDQSGFAMKRRSLPVFAVKDALLSVVRENQVVIVVGETGSGKTTQLPQYLLHEGYADFGVIGCTQPRRVAAVSVAHRVAQELASGDLGETVGYAIRFEDRSSAKTRIKYMTDGILMRETLSDPDLDRYSVIVMDEAHERSLNTDVLFGTLRGVLSRRLDLKLVVTSATLDSKRFAGFFGGAPIFRIPGRTFPVDRFFSKTPVEDYVDGAVWQVMHIHTQAPLPGDILVFMTGQEDVETTCDVLAEKVSKIPSIAPLLILPIYSQLPSDLQARVFAPPPKNTRKVVVATNIAETSLTIDGIQFVVDSGLCKLKTFNPRLGIDALLLCPASQAAAEQRAGRAGRTGPGKCYRLYTETAFATELLETNVPEIQRTNLGHVVLLLKSLGVKDILDFPFLDPPPRPNVLKSMVALWYIGALDTSGSLTVAGERMSTFPLDPSLSALLLLGNDAGCLSETVTIVSMLSVPSVFNRPRGQEGPSDDARAKFLVPESDHLTLLHVFQRWHAAGSSPAWCKKHFINSKLMKRADEVRRQLQSLTLADGMEPSSTDNWDLIRRTVAAAFYYQAAKRRGMKDYMVMRSGVACELHPTSSLFGNGLTPEYVVYHELVFTGRQYVSCVSAVEPEWLAESKYGALLYKLRKSSHVSQ